MERAYALRDAREKERARFVKEKYDEQWRDACDDARTLDSKAMTKAMNQERIAQIQDKLRRKEQVSGQENSFLTEWNRQLEELERRDLAKQEMRRRVDRETSNEIKAQVGTLLVVIRLHKLTHSAPTSSTDRAELPEPRAALPRDAPRGGGRTGSGE